MPTLAAMDVTPAEAFGMLLVAVIGIPLIILIAYIPPRIAKARGHESADAIGVCSAIGLFIWPLWVVALIWAHTGPDRSKDAQSKDHVRMAGKPTTTDVSPPREEDDLGDLPGRFDVFGVDRDSGLDTKIMVRAESPANARVKAELKGIVVTRVDRVLEGASA